MRWWSCSVTARTLPSGCAAVSAVYSGQLLLAEVTASRPFWSGGFAAEEAFARLCLDLPAADAFVHPIARSDALLPAIDATKVVG